MTALVRVEVIRRDPLSTALIASELDDWTATTGAPPPRGTHVVPPTPGNAHWSGTGDRTGSGPVPRSTLDERDDVAPVVIEHPAPPLGAERPAPVPDRGGDWSDYV